MIFGSSIGRILLWSVLVPCIVIHASSNLDSNPEEATQHRHALVTVTKNPTNKPTSTPTRNTTNKPTATTVTSIPRRKPTKKPTQRPTRTPTCKPASRPKCTNKPSLPRVRNPANTPTAKPVTSMPTKKRTKKPTQRPTRTPRNKPTLKPATSAPTTNPTKEPTQSPTHIPTSKPTSTPRTLRPTRTPRTSRPTRIPTNKPTAKPVTSTPTRNPTKEPTLRPTYTPTNEPTLKPATLTPTRNPTQEPTLSPTHTPTNKPTSTPTRNPTNMPTAKPVTSSPTTHPTKEPSPSPTHTPIKKPTLTPTRNPTDEPTLKPVTSRPTKKPTKKPTPRPTRMPLNKPTSTPTRNPSNEPTLSPTRTPTNTPTLTPMRTTTDMPTAKPVTSTPTRNPSNEPTLSPTRTPTNTPTLTPMRTTTDMPTADPVTSTPTRNPTNEPTSRPTRAPRKKLTARPTRTPTNKPSASVSLTSKPTAKPSENPSESPSEKLTSIPTSRTPSKIPTLSPTVELPQSPSRSPSKSPTNTLIDQSSPPTSLQWITGLVGVPIYPHSTQILTVLLPSSEPETLLTFSQVTLNSNDAVPVSRSYDGYEWEKLHPLLLPLVCQESCLVDIPPGGPDVLEIGTHYIIQKYTPRRSTNEQIFAKLLLQGTYGPTQESLQNAISLGSATAWVANQINSEPTLLREHYRKRANGYIKTDLHHHATRMACEPGSRWNRHAFNRWRDIGKEIVEVQTGWGTYYLKVDGIVRTEVEDPPSAQYELPGKYVICRKDPANPSTKMSDFFFYAPLGRQGSLLVAPTPDGCANPISITMPGVEFSNPRDAFGEDIPSVRLVSLSGDPNVFEAKLLEDKSVNCSVFRKTWPNFARDNSTGRFYIEDRRVELYDNRDGLNTKKTRLLGGRCPHSPRTFLNEDTCVIRFDCSPPVYEGSFRLNAENLRAFYEIDGKYVYRLEALPLVDTPTPCDVTSSRHRFVRKRADNDENGCGGNGNTLFPSIVSAIEGALSNVTVEEQHNVRVIDIEGGIECDDPNEDAIGASFTASLNGSLSCWTHSYYREWSVFVMNDWVSHHPGNPRFFRESKPNPIAFVAEHENVSGDLEESISLKYPPWGFHRDNYNNNRLRFENELIGSWGDIIRFDDMISSAKSTEVIKFLGGSVISDRSAAIEVCGSPGEVGNDPSLGHQYLLQKYGDALEEDASTLDQDHDRWVANHMVYNTVSLHAKDQLRQRIAWALSSIFVVTMKDISRGEIIEPWAVYYDIFVRNAFGNFFDILKEVTFSPLMGWMLTFKDSKSFAYQFERNDAELYPDENFSREIMQLFSIGLYMLNQDGTKVIDNSTGLPVPTYTNKDIMNFARGFTNFVDQVGERDNIEAEWSTASMYNAIDPMYLPTSEGRDVFPKQTLIVNGDIGYIGDKVQRCDTLIQTRAWLRKGAVFHFRPNSQSNMGKKDPDWWIEPESWSPRLVLQQESSALYAKLCNYNRETSQCDFRSTVVLDEDLDCDGSCTAKQGIWEGIDSPCECSIDEPRTFRLDHSPPVWYEYVRAPCIQMAFPETGTVHAVREVGESGYGNKAMCADSRLPVAGTVCCDSRGLNPTSICVFRGERTTYATANDRCSEYKTGWKTCTWDTVPVNYDCGTDTNYDQGEYSSDSSPGLRFSWTSEPCKYSVQIDAEGNIAIINLVGELDVKERVLVDSGTYFGAIWANQGSYPTVETGCDGICTVHFTTCVCNDVQVETTVVFSNFPSLSDMLTKLHLGASSPSLVDQGTYHLCTAAMCSIQPYKIFSRSLVDSDSELDKLFDAEIIFEISTQTEPLFLHNTKSTVQIGSLYSFRNPPMFNSPVDPTQRDGLYETDAILHQYVDHPNTAPFIANKLINLLVSSNPSPRYVRSAADAFSSGTFVSDGHSFGAGRYGDMEALVASIMLDREARSSTLDDDSNHGRAREPLLKILHMTRSMNLSTESPGVIREVGMINLKERGIGQESFNAPSVFSFFLGEYQPVGPVLAKNLFAPETQLFDAGMLISFVNGFFSLQLYGLSDCQGWQGFGDARSRFIIPDYPDAGEHDCDYLSDPGGASSQLRLRYRPPSWGGTRNVNDATTSKVIEDIDLLLTGGRLSADNKAILEEVYNVAHSGSHPDDNALRTVLQHYSVLPEFHITNNLMDSKISNAAARRVPNIVVPESPRPVTGYKALVYLFLAGAMDSYSALVPVECDLQNQYIEVRGDIAISSGLLQVDASSSNQPCDSFGLHPSLENVHQLYNEGSASFVANIGPLIEPMDKYEFLAQTKRQPPALFAHNTQTQVTQTVFSQDPSVDGVLSRIGDAINKQEGKAVFDAYTVSGTPKILEGAPGASRPAGVLNANGVASFNNITGQYEDNFEALTQNIASSVYGETFSASMTNAIYRMRLFDGAIGQLALAHDGCFDALGTDIAGQFKQVARVIKSRNVLESKRDAFYTSHDGYDTHSDNGPTLTALLKEIDDAIGCFALEMKSQGVWNNVTVMSAAEFGRTLTSNGLGTDHAWGGNHFIAGGSVRGGLIHGQYPSDLSEESILNVGRGRLIPTTSWEGLWNGLAEWFGVKSQNIRAVLPNIGNFPSNVFTASDLFV